MLGENFGVVAEAARLDSAVAKAFGLSRQKARQAILRGEVRLNGRSVRVFAREAKVGDKLSLAPAAAEHAAEATTLKLLFEDKDLVVIEKPAALLSERLPTEKGRAVLDVLAEQRIKGYLVHRLDAGTSGAMLVARTPEMAEHLSQAFRDKTVRKLYALLCSGGTPGVGAYDQPLGRDPLHPRRFAIRHEGKASRTEYMTLAAKNDFAFAVAAPITGRTHQIRVHFASAGHPLLGDALYAGLRRHGSLLVHRPLLHAWRLQFTHPRTRKAVEIVSPIPADFAAAATALELGPQFLTGPPPFGTFGG